MEANCIVYIDGLNISLSVEMNVSHVKICELAWLTWAFSRALERGGHCRVSRSNILQCRMST